MLFYVNVQEKTKYEYQLSDTIKINDDDGLKGEKMLMNKDIIFTKIRTRSFVQVADQGSKT